ncbi:sulfite reductase flavoprotein subunit alpha [Comamonas squillarum]|uniref:Sulfite reductase flavoprotein subunit alpha n=2 Tax=Comamonas TaxID=283 RepID=A0ABY6A4F6_9BURK|nr:sulfite reductase flavoprotein subunit alpha [Comamonas sp. PR12]UXC19892.1 sulfite reductase flavoprotein subunit alpha [Comamonas sp. PR12]
MWSFKNIWFQIHWLIGITAGTVLIVIGLTGATYSFQDEVLDWANPGTASVPVQPSPALTPPQLLAAVRASGEQRRIDRITLYAEPGRSAQLAFAPEKGERRGQSVYLHPYTGAQLPAQSGREFFEWNERLHRWLLLPRDDGKPITGSLSLCLLLLSLSGLYLRWPAKPLSWRSWLTFNVRRKGRPFLWGLHSVAGTWVLVVYVMLTLTGMYWAFDAVRAPVDRWMGAPSRAAARAEQSAAQEAARKAPPLQIEPASLEPAWQGFTQLASGWQFAQMRLPQRADQPVQFSWWGAGAPHDRARNQLSLSLDGSVQRDDRFADLPAGRRALAAIYPLHTGTYFGLTGRIIVTVAALMMPLFAITGWLLYLERRRSSRAAAKAQRALLAGDGPQAGPTRGANTGASMAVVYASQAGHAQQLAVRTVARLRSAGLAAQLLPAASLDMVQLQPHRQLLWVASTFGEGQPPDSARRLARLLQQTQGTPLAHQRFGMLALGDRQYGQFCGFGLALAAQLERLGAQPVFAPITMDAEDDAAWQAWLKALAAHWGVNAEPATVAVNTAASVADSDAPDAVFAPAQLLSRHHLNPGSSGQPLYQVELGFAPEQALQWQAGGLVEVKAQQAPAQVDAWLQAHQLDGSAAVQWRGSASSLRDALSACELPTLSAPATSAQAVADQLHPLAPRSYSLASLPADGRMRLYVRQTLREQPGAAPQLGLASGWLTAHAALGSSIALRLVDNPGFAPLVGDARPAIFMGNGSGYAGLRGHLCQRIAQGQFDNWLIFGERRRAHDSYAEDEVCVWQAHGQIARADYAYSRDARDASNLAPGQGPHRYVQDALRAAAEPLQAWLARGAVIYVCGSYDGMATGVDDALTELLGEEGLNALIDEGRYRRDVY